MSVESSPEFQAALQRAADGALKDFLYGSPKQSKSKKSRLSGSPSAGSRVPLPPDDLSDPDALEKYRAELNRYTKRIRFEAELRSNEHYREIMAGLSQKSSSGLICAKCRGKDTGNRMNRKPWCMVCNLPLMTPEDAAEWMPPKKPSMFGPGFNEVEVARVRR